MRSELLTRLCRFQWSTQRSSWVVDNCEIPRFGKACGQDVLSPINPAMLTRTSIEEKECYHSPKRRALGDSAPVPVDANAVSPPRSPERHNVTSPTRVTRCEPWKISESDFPHEGSRHEQLSFLVRYAQLAPSTYNSQPWMFRIDERQNIIDLLSDASRSLPVVDPHDRQLLIACGAAFYQLRLAATHFGFFYSYELLPDSESNVVARLRLSIHPQHNSFGSSSLRRPMEEEKMFNAITHRRSNNEAYADKPVPEDFLTSIKTSVEEEPGVWLHWIKGSSQKTRVADLTAESMRKQVEYQPYREELFKWIRPNYNSSTMDGLPCGSVGISSINYWMGNYQRSNNWAKNAAEKKHLQTRTAPVLAVLGTRVDSDREWIIVGQSLVKALLSCTMYGLSVSQHNQALELPQLRSQLQEILGSATVFNHVVGLPQVILRVGYSREGEKELRPSPRRCTDAVMMVEPVVNSTVTSPTGSPHSQ
ncbi:nitroreductase [Planoprotostelium fungivorum]|uniref:Nitroreductase n=1 Tax=Planoprotostelium fungivorum TaxID=1890364 RepID=A0A2P6MPG4_9EUKA|nr:nitroreductase [Planoprotostelium fungivorum]